MIWLMLACVGKDTASPLDDTSEPQCGAIDGIVTGLITDEHGYVQPGALVHYASPDGEETGSVQADENGVYEIGLIEGDWVLAASDEWEECWSEDFEFQVTACEETLQDVAIEDCEVADKPNLYLYPERPVPTSVQLRLQRKQRVVASDPPYRHPGWRGVALPDGRWSQARQEILSADHTPELSPFLFYEVSLAPWMKHTFQREEGWCVPGEDAVYGMAAILELYNFNANEVDDFVEAWWHDLPWAESYAVMPQLEVDHMAEVLIQPALPLERLWLIVEDGAGCSLREPAVVPFDRSGAHAVEWGVVLEGLGR